MVRALSDVARDYLSRRLSDLGDRILDGAPGHRLKFVEVQFVHTVVQIGHVIPLFISRAGVIPAPSRRPSRGQSVDRDRPAIFLANGRSWRKAVARGKKLRVTFEGISRKSSKRSNFKKITFQD